MNSEKNLTFVIMGATGDLAKLKLIPALYKLLKLNVVSRVSLIGVARSVVTIQSILDEAKNNIKDLDLAVWDNLCQSAYYQKLDFDNIADFENLHVKIKEVEQKHGLSGNRLFYLATLPEHFARASENLAKVGLVNSKDNKWERVLYEKPFGDNHSSARQINKSIDKVFEEKNVFRVDHYLGKELVGNIALLRFTNRILEPLWNNKHLDSVQIICDENFGIKNRGNYFDKYGAVKDMLQNHLLQILSLIAMESPKFLAGEYLRDQKVKVLKKTKVKDIILGQYDGYTQEKGVSADSTTETFFAARLEINNKRWRGVPFFIRSGKNLNKKETVIHLRFKAVDCLLSKSCPSDSNYLTIRIEPNEGYSFELNSKSLRQGFEIETVDMDYCHHCQHGVNTPEAYEILLEQAIAGEQSVFVRNDEVELAWKIVDRIQMKDQVVYKYPVGSSGPKELADWNKKNNIIWKS
ncbi:MAG: glucose-6-phosphate dehydrogenase [Candidatus Paceibacterota bacterium]